MTSNINTAIASTLANLNDRMFGTMHYKRVENVQCDNRWVCVIYADPDYSRLDDEPFAYFCNGHYTTVREVHGMLRGCREVTGRNIELTVLPWEGRKLGRKVTLQMVEPERFYLRSGFDGDVSWTRTWGGEWKSRRFTEDFDLSPWRSV